MPSCSAPQNAPEVARSELKQGWIGTGPANAERGQNPLLNFQGATGLPHRLTRFLQILG